MTERTWIKIHNGLTNDPKHRDRLGVRIWLFIWLLDHVDWETGVVPNYTDAWAAQEMGSEEYPISPRTIEKQRQQLEADGYITCHLSQTCQFIRIMRFRNPRLVNPPQINVPDDLMTWPDYEHLKARGTQLVVPRPAENVVPLTLDSHESDSKGADAPKLDWNDYGQVLHYMNENKNPIGVVGDAFKFLFPAYTPKNPSMLYGRIGKIVKLLIKPDLMVSGNEYSRVVKEAARTVLLAVYGTSLIQPTPADPMDYLYKYIEGQISPIVRQQQANEDLVRLIQQETR